MSVPMQRAIIVHTAGAWDNRLETDCIIIDFDHRHRRRILLSTVSGGEVLLDLPQATRLRDGDALETERGHIIRVVAQAEKLLEVHTQTLAEMMRIAWHLGNRHLPIQILGESIHIRNDHVIGAMVRQLGGHTKAIVAPFDPETGAYSGSTVHFHGE